MLIKVLCDDKNTLSFVLFHFKELNNGGRRNDRNMSKQQQQQQTEGKEEQVMLHQQTDDTSQTDILYMGLFERYPRNLHESILCVRR